LADLKDQIKDQLPYLQSLKGDELLIRQTQFQLSTIRQTTSNNPDFSQVLLSIANITPKNIKLTNITLDRSQSFPKTSLAITGQTPSNVELTAFLKALQQNPHFVDITLTNISFEGQTLFTITGSLSDRGGKSS
jgi:Tfp pilus assembly protein PilN